MKTGGGNMHRLTFKKPDSGGRLTKLLSAGLLFGSLLMTENALARARYLDVSLSGSYTSDVRKYLQSTRKSFGVELGLPVTSFFDVSLAHTNILDREVYNDLYREVKKSQGVAVPEGDIEQVTRSLDSSVNAGFGYPIGYVKPTLFGGALWRRSCLEDTFESYGCLDQDVTWNAGVSLSVFITMSTRFRISYRRSPSAAQESSKKNFDELTSIGLTWGL
jgi:hypothetical protein